MPYRSEQHQQQVAATTQLHVTALQTAPCRLPSTGESSVLYACAGICSAVSHVVIFIAENSWHASHCHVALGHYLCGARIC